MSNHHSSPPPFSSLTKQLLMDTGRCLGVPSKECGVFSRSGQLQLGSLSFSIYCQKTKQREPAWLIALQPRPDSLGELRWCQALLRANWAAQFCGQWGFALAENDLGALYIALGPDQQHPQLLSASFRGALQFWSDLLHGAHEKQDESAIAYSPDCDDYTDPSAELEAPRAVRVLIAESLLELGFPAADAQSAAQRGAFILDHHPVSLTMAVDSQTLMLVTPLQTSQIEQGELQKLLRLNSVIIPAMGIATAATATGLQVVSRWPLEPRQPTALARWLRLFANFAGDICGQNAHTA